MFIWLEENVYKCVIMLFDMSLSIQNLLQM